MSRSRAILGTVARGELRRRSRAHGVRRSRCAADVPTQDVLAAVLAGGPEAFAVTRAAAQLWELPLPQPAAVEVTVVIERQARLEGVRVTAVGLLIT